MPRSPRIILPDYPHHVVHRGRNRRVIFQGPGDYSSYLDSLGELKGLYGVKLLAYCLMPKWRPGSTSTPWFLALGFTIQERQRAYLDFLREGVSEDRLRLIRDAVRRGQLTGGPGFGREVERVLGRLVLERGPGRPTKNSSVPFLVV